MGRHLNSWHIFISFSHFSARGDDHTMAKNGLAPLSYTEALIDWRHLDFT